MNKIQRIKNVVRLGRIDRIEEEKIIFKSSSNALRQISYPTNVGNLHIDCSAAGTNFPPSKEKIWDGSQMHLQILGTFHPTGVIAASASAAMIAAIELRYKIFKGGKICVLYIIWIN